MNLEQRISNIERNTSTAITGAGFMAVGDPLKFYVNNRTGATITKGQVVYISGASGNKITVALAKANAESTSSKTFGVAEANIANNASGWIVVTGEINKLNTAAYADGDTLYLSPTTAGAWATTKPSAPNHLVYVGFVSRSHATVGSIFVKTQNGYELDEIHDVAITSKTDHDLLVYESASGLWKNQQMSTLPTSGRIELVNTTSTQSIANGGSASTVGNGTGTTAWTVSENIGGIFTHSLGRVTCSEAGRYSVWGGVRWSENNTTLRRLLVIAKNAGGTVVDLAGTTGQAVSVMRQTVAIPSVRLAANDTLDLMVFQDSGGARTLGAATATPHYFIVEYLGA
jgi:hypothetical protein